MDLGAADLRILSILGKDPMMAKRSIASKVGLSRDTVSRHIELLRERGDLLGVAAQVRYNRVGLQTTNVTIKCQPEAWPLLERMSQLHPYTQYRIRITGDSQGFLARFALPLGTVSMLTELLETLVDRKQIETYDISTPSATAVTSEMDFTKYKLGEGWVFDWLEWERGWKGDAPPLAPLLNSLHHELDNSDMRILREVSLDIFRPQREIARAAGVSDSRLSRRLDFFRDKEIIEGYRILVGEFLTGVASVAIFKCKANFRAVKTIAAAVPTLPFQSTLIPESDSFLFYVTIPHGDASTVLKILQRHCSSVQMLICDYLSSYRWGFYPDAFLDGQWRADHDYMVTDVLRQLDGVPRQERPNQRS